TIAVRSTVLAAEHAARSIAHAIARGVAARRLLRLQHQIEGDAEAAAKLSVAAGTGTEFMLAEMQRETHFGDFETAEFEAADRVPLADRRPAVTAGRSAAAGAGVKHVPDEIAPGARVF